MIGIIAAVSMNGVIGIDGHLPFNYPADLKHFKNTTINSTIIMGRKTFEGIGRPLPKRNNIVISSRKIEIEGITTFASVSEAALSATMNQDIWFIGGATIYEAGMEFADKIVLTLTPDYEARTPAVRFPWINPLKFKLERTLKLSPEDPACQLMIATYTKI